MNTPGFPSALHPGVKSSNLRVMNPVSHVLVLPYNPTKHQTNSLDHSLSCYDPHQILFRSLLPLNDRYSGHVSIQRNSHLSSDPARVRCYTWSNNKLLSSRAKADLWWALVSSKNGVLCTRNSPTHIPIPILVSGTTWDLRVAV